MHSSTNDMKDFCTIKCHLRVVVPVVCIKLFNCTYWSEIHKTYFGFALGCLKNSPKSQQFFGAAAMNMGENEWALESFSHIS